MLAGTCCPGEGTMRHLALVIAASAALAAAAAEPQGFDACLVFTQADAESALGGPAQPPPENPKVKRPKVVPACAYNGTRDGKPVAASAHFRIGKSDEETQK